MSRETFQSLRMLLMEKLDLARELTDEEILEEIDTLILERMRDSCLSLKEKVQLRQELFHSVRKLDVLQELIEDETVTMKSMIQSIFPSWISYFSEADLTGNKCWSVKN